MMKHLLKSIFYFSFLLMNIFDNPQLSAQNDAVTSLYCKSIVIPNITYLTIDSIALQLDAYIPAKNLGGNPWVEFTEDRKPVLLYIHGGGWTDLNRTIRNLNIMPYIDKGFAVVNIDYRLLYQAPFPACIADCRYALNWIYENAAQYKFDTTRIVVSGESAGGHLALMTGFMKDDHEIFVPEKPITRDLKVAAVINWFGVTDMEKIVDFWNSEDFVRSLTGDSLTKEYIYETCSPLMYVNPAVPPVLTIHGDRDDSVPFIHAQVLHDALNENQVKNKLVIIEGKRHGDFDENEISQSFDAIWKFLKELGIVADNPR
jgi:acetyl esterase/lipase